MTVQGLSLALDWCMNSDTTKEAAQVRVAALRKLGGPARLKQALELSDTVRRLAEQGQRDREDMTPRVAGVRST